LFACARTTNTPYYCSDVDVRSVKAFNGTCELWSVMDRKMESLLNSERKKKHLGGNILDSLGLQTIGKVEKKRAITNMLKEKRRMHVKNIQQVYVTRANEATRRESAKQASERKAGELLCVPPHPFPLPSSNPPPPATIRCWRRGRKGRR